MSDQIKRFYQQCDPAVPLSPDDRRYVSFEGVRGSGDLVERIERSIRRSNRPMSVLFSGHRGAGKSTELLRMQKNLETASDAGGRYFVVYFEASEDFDVNDVDLPDVLLSIVRHIASAAKQKVGIDLRHVKIARFWKDIKELLGREVAIEKLDMTAGFAKLTATIKSSPSTRSEIRKALEPRVSSLIEAANEMLDECVLKLKAQGFEDLVLIVDNLDRIILRQIPGSEFNTHEQLFINRGSQLAQLNCHVVYTIPISMIFSPKAIGLRTIYGKPPSTLPMVKVIKRDGADDPDGLMAMRALVHRRIEEAGISDPSSVASPETIDNFCRMSGGHARNLLISLRGACDYLDALPIRQETADKSVQGMRTDFERALNRSEYFDILHKVDESQDLPCSVFNQDLLYNISILEYLNGNDEPFYAVNPVVRTMDKFITRSESSTSPP